MYLYAQGIHPLVRMYRKPVRYEESWEEAAERALEDIQHGRVLSQESKTEIMEYYKNSSVNGRYSSEDEMYNAMMVWAYPQGEDLKFDSGSAGQNLPKQEDILEGFFPSFPLRRLFSARSMRLLPPTPDHVRDKHGIRTTDIYMSMQIIT